MIFSPSHQASRFRTIAAPRACLFRRFTRPALLFALLWLCYSAQAGSPTFQDVGALFTSPATDTVKTNAPATGMNSMNGLDDKYRLAVGDRLSFRILEDEDDSRQLIVTDVGCLEVPYLGRYEAVGKTCKTLARELKAELEKDYYRQATVVIAVDLMGRSRGKLYLFGSVRMTGALEIPSDEVFTLSKAILRAGGFLATADKHNVKITRPAASPGTPDQVIKVDVAAILEKGQLDADVQLQPGDLIYVRERMTFF